MRALIVASLALAWGGCTRLPDVYSTGEQESPCRTANDCRDGLFCLSLDSTSFCTRGCAGPGDCERGYACDLERGVCLPSRTEGQCRPAESRCGPSFDPCCAGSQCVELAPYGTFCARACNRDATCDTGCCASAGGAGVCAFPTYCE